MVGRLFSEFAVTLSVTILISAVVSLSLVPMMCALLLRSARPPRSPHGRRVDPRPDEVRQAEALGAAGSAA